MDLLKSLNYPEEVLALIRYKMSSVTTNSMVEERELSPTMKKCYKYLTLTSRSFAAVIQALDVELRDAVCIFYLVLRALDTVEDDMSIVVERKVDMLVNFYTYLEDPQWNFVDSTEKDRMVLIDFPVISGEYRKLAPVYREVISDVCKRMGQGMTVFLTRSPDSVQEWDEYCHYVAGLVGLGLTRIFTGSGLENPDLLGTEEGLWLANSMGLFLQKTNIIRDYLEDVKQDRLFWPKQVWGKYASEMVELVREENSSKALQCLNELVTNALLHIPNVLDYLSRIHNQSIFNFCAIPQVMAIATLERCYNNIEVFRGVVKIRKGEAVRLMQKATNINNVKSIFSHFTNQIKYRIPPGSKGLDFDRNSFKNSLETCQLHESIKKEPSVADKSGIKTVTVAEATDANFSNNFSLSEDSTINQSAVMFTEAGTGAGPAASSQTAIPTSTDNSGVSQGTVNITDSILISSDGRNFSDKPVNEKSANVDGNLLRAEKSAVNMEPTGAKAASRAASAARFTYVAGSQSNTAALTSDKQAINIPAVTAGCWPIGTLEVVNKALLVSHTSAAVYSCSNRWMDYFLSLPILLSLILLLLAFWWPGTSNHLENLEV